MTLYDENFFGGDARFLVEPQAEVHTDVPHPWTHIAWQDAYAYFGECLAALHEQRKEHAA